MYVLTRYVVTEILKIFFLALIALTLIVTVVFGVKEGLAQGLPPLVMLRTMPYMLPETLGITLPVSLLLSVCIVYGRMTGLNEVVALKSLGINPMVIIWPAIVLAVLLSLGAVWMQEIAATWGRPNYYRAAAESIEEIAYGRLLTIHTYSSPQFSITVKRVEGKKLIQPTITIYDYGSNATTTLRAAEAELHYDHQAQGLYIICRDVKADLEGKIQISDPTEIRRFLPIDDPGRRKGTQEHHRDWLAMYEIPQHISQLQAEVLPLQQRQEALRNSGQTLSPAESVHLANLWTLIHRLRTEPYRRLSNGFTCLCFVLIGVPMAMLWRHADVLTNFFVCFVPILAVYYPLLMLGEDLSTSGKLPPISFWMGNFLLIVAGVLLLRRIVRH
jgi:lipopolysaccharide export system permease protein